MQAVPVPDHDDVVDALVQVRADCSAAELHGLMVGLLASGARLNRQALMRQLEVHADVGQPFSDAAQAGLWQLQLATLADLDADELSFQPLLPSDDRPLNDRALALGDFCRGWLAGFGIGVDNQHELLSRPETRETLQDLTHIAQIDAVEEEDEAGEEAFVELVEFVRLAVLHFFDELMHQAPAAPDPTTLH